MKNIIFISTLFILIKLTITPFESRCQIIYTDIVPDTIINGHFDIDINNDNIIDFTFRDSTKTVSSVNCSAVKVNHYFLVTPFDSTLDLVAIDTAYGSTIPTNLAFDSIVNNPLFIWSGSPKQKIEYRTFVCSIIKGMTHYWRATNSGDFYSGGYMGFKFSIGGNFHYGWIHIIFNTSPSMIITGYAYNSSPDSAIFAGQQGSEHLVINSVTPSPYCMGTPVVVDYSVTGTFDTSNVFTLQLSDSTGSFANPINVGSIHSIVSGTINAIIPSSIVASYLYHFRIISSSSPVVSSPNVNDLTIYAGTADPQIYSSGLTNICQGTYVELSVGMDDGFTFQWKHNGVSLFNDTANYYNANDTGWYNCEINNTCGIILSDSLLITFLPLPYSTLTVNSSLWICPGYQVMLHANVAPNYYYEWLRNGVIIQSANDSTYLAIQTGRYSVRVTDNVTGCQNRSEEDTVNMSMHTSYIAALGPTAVCAGDTVDLLKTSLSDTSFIYQWYRDGNIISGSTFDTCKAIQSGVYALKITNPSGNCSTISQGINVIVGCVGIKEVGSKDHFTFENKNNMLLITRDILNKEHSVIQILNSLGELYFSKEAGSVTTIDVSHFANGLYFLKWTEDKYSEIKPVTIIN